MKRSIGRLLLAVTMVIAIPGMGSAVEVKTRKPAETQSPAKQQPMPEAVDAIKAVLNRVGTLETSVAELATTVNERDREIETLKKAIAAKEHSLADKNRELQERVSEYVALKGAEEQLRALYAAKETEMGQTRETLKDKEASVDSARKQISSLYAQVAELKKNLDSAAGAAAEQEVIIKGLRNDVHLRDTNSERQNNEIKNIRKELADNINAAKGLDSELKSVRNELQQMQKTRSERELYINALETDLDDLRTQKKQVYVVDNKENIYELDQRTNQLVLKGNLKGKLSPK